MADGKVMLGWWEGEVYRTTHVALVDVSLHGVQLIVEDPLPRGTVAWVYLHEVGLIDWIECEVVGVEPLDRRRSRVRMRFKTGCPYHFFRSAVQGCSLQGHRTPAPSEEFSDRLWR